MTFDFTTIAIIIGVALALGIILLLVARGRRQTIKRDTPRRGDDPYAVDKARPHMPPADRPIDIVQPAVPLAGDFAGIAFPPHSTDHPDPLTRLKGVGPKLETLLNQEGITRYEQLASLDDAALAALDARMGAFQGRLARDRVVEQARLLASGDTAGFEETFGKLGD